jgi:hypothetical protein
MNSKLRPNQPVYPVDSNTPSVTYTQDGEPVPTRGMPLIVYLAAHAQPMPEGWGADLYPGMPTSRRRACWAATYAKDLLEELNT